MKNNILNQILTYKKKWIDYHIKKLPLKTLKNMITMSKRNFYNTVSKKKQTIFILECKKASPSYGIIRKNFNPIKIAKIYKNYASVISVLTDEKFFHGNFNFLKQVSEVVSQPILCKDFFITEWQIYFARLYQADAILLILSILDDITYKKLLNTAHNLNMGVLTEISNETELKRAKLLESKVIGINNRNLNDFSTDINRTIILSKKIPNSIITISESGINNHSQIKYLRKYVNGFLIGTKLMKQSNLNIALNKLILGENKVCGLTQTIDALIIQELGAIYGGLIFVSKSPRYITINSAKNITLNTKHLRYVGVFQNSPIINIIKKVDILKLSVVQLHGQENQEYIKKLRTNLPNTCNIWKSIDMANYKNTAKHDFSYVHRYLLDNGNGGTGKKFNWMYLKNIKLEKIILAGGLTIKNCKKAMKLGCLGLDFNSGVESSPGIKNHKKIKKIFNFLRSY